VQYGIAFGHQTDDLGNKNNDRMVWLYEEMKNVEPEYRSWMY
jgi:hypothetical protein